MGQINDLVNSSYQNAVDKGFHDDPRSVGDLIALMHSELSEAFEHYRDGHLPADLFYTENGKPDGVAVELADVVIRIFDFCGRYRIDLETIIEQKMAYNATRPHKHGGKVL
jgi:NTP pyrophosphatase (non-canonical NTP hydrolase)